MANIKEARRSSKPSNPKKKTVSTIAISADPISKAKRIKAAASNNIFPAQNAAKLKIPNRPVFS